MHAWGLRLRSAWCALALFRAPQYCLPVGLTPSAPLILPFSELTTSGYPAYMCPCPSFLAPLFGGSAWSILQRFKCALSVRPHMARGQDGFATPFLYDSFIHNSTPVYPGALSILLDDIELTGSRS